MKNYRVKIVTGEVTLTFPVESFEIKGSALVPVYDNGTTPQDESPVSVVTIEEVPA